MKTNLLQTKHKSKLFTAAVIAITVATFASGTLAYFTADEVAHNVITSAGIKIEIIEKQKVGDELVDYPTEIITGVMPATEVSKIVTIQNNDAKAWVRVQVEKSIELKGEGTVNLDLVEIEFNTEYWWKDGDYWYYKSPLGVGETTEPLFTTVKFSENMGNEYQNCEVDVIVTAEAIQYANMTESIMTKEGWFWMGETNDTDTETAN